MNRRHWLLTTASTALSTSPFASYAQGSAPSFPKAGGTIKYIVPFSAGGITDIAARAVGAKLSEAWKVPVVVENKEGGNAQMGAELVAKGPADGMQLLAITTAHVINATLFPKANYDFVKDLRPVALLADAPIVLIVPGNSPIKDFKSLLSVSKSKQLNAGSAGNGTTSHLAIALFNDLNKCAVTHLPYKGGIPALTDLKAGQLDLMFSTFPECIEDIRAGRVHALAVCGLGRYAEFPNLPTAMEAGLPGLYVENWTGVMIQAGTPETIVDAYAREIVKIRFNPQLEVAAKKLGYRISTKNREDFAAMLKLDLDRWARIIKVAKIKV